MGEKRVSKLSIGDISEGSIFEFDEQITSGLVDAFAEMSGDYSPLHMDAQFAKVRGFNGRVAHGGIFMLFFSKAVGMMIPGENALLQSIKMNFLSPVYPTADIKIVITVTAVSEAMKTLVLKGVAIGSDDTVYCRAAIQVGFTESSV
jgi:acyl dehydratase